MADEPVALDMRQRQRAEALQAALAHCPDPANVEVVLRLARWVLDGDNRLPQD